MSHKPLECRCGDVPGLAELLQRHPGVILEAGMASAALEFSQGSWRRQISVGVGGGLFGLIESMDNNPLVCADLVRVPGPASTLALIALGPLVQAGLLCRPPVLIGSCPGSAFEVAGSLAAIGLSSGATVDVADGPQPVAALEAVASVAAEPGDLEALFTEAYGRSFFVRRHHSAEWEPALVEGRPYALYRLEPGAEGPDSLRVRVISDKRGKCGAAQIVHTLNVMAGFEETLGLAY